MVLTLHLAFKRTAPAIQRCKNQQQGRSYAAVLGSASRARMTASLGLVPAFARRRHDQSDAAKIIEIGLRLFFLLRTSKEDDTRNPFAKMSRNGARTAEIGSVPAGTNF